MTLSAINRLLIEMSWCQWSADDYRTGGHHREDVLTTHVLQAIDFLPRSFLAAVLRQSARGVGQCLLDAADRIDEASVTVLPNDPYLGSVPKSSLHFPRVQPDAIVESPHVYGWVEAKRVNGGSFQETQLAREYYSATKSADGRQPFLLLLVGEPPPVRVANVGRVSVVDGIGHGLTELHAGLSPHPESLDRLVASIDLRVGWLTWSELGNVLNHHLNVYASAPRDVFGTLTRIVESASTAIEVHSRSAA